MICTKILLSVHQKETNAKRNTSAIDTHVSTERMNMSGGPTFGESTEKIVKSFWKTLPERDSKYINWIRNLPCIICQFPFSDPHHTETGGKGTKASDYTCLPLCHNHHLEVHQVGKQTFQEKHGINFKEVCKRLNTIWKETLL